MIKETSESYYLFYRNKISTIINQMSDNVKHWYTSFFILFSIYISVFGILINYKDIFDNLNNKIIACVITYVVCLLGNVVCFYNVWKYLKIEKCFRELEYQATYKIVNCKYKFVETYDWSSVLKNINVKRKIYHSMHRSFVFFTSSIFTFIGCIASIMFTILLFMY